MRRRLALSVCLLLGALSLPQAAFADGKIVRPKSYHGSLEEVSQEAIIIFTPSEKPGEAVEDLILKIGVRGDASHFAWVIPFPNEPAIGREDADLFHELFTYVAWRKLPAAKPKHDDHAKSESKGDKPGPAPVQVIRRETVGSYDVAIVRENEAGALNDWLRREDFQPLPETADDVLGFYRKKVYVFACVKVTGAQSESTGPIDLHPLRFTFRTGGSDGIYFPMKMTGLQDDPFLVNLYVFYRRWINDDVSRFGFVHRGFQLKYRDWDSDACEPNAGKLYSDPANDPFLHQHTRRLKRVSDLFARLHPGERYYLTNIQAHVEPEEIREWDTDLWLFPYYTDPDRVPVDAQPGGPADGAWLSPQNRWWTKGRVVVMGLGAILALSLIVFLACRRRGHGIG